MTIKCRFNAEIMFCYYIPQVLRLLKMGYGVSKRSGRFLIKVRRHDLAFSTRLVIFFYRPCDFRLDILCSFEITASVGSVVKYIQQKWGMQGRSATLR